jgi:lysophosphatidic acid acyltransferase/lysophosphatidylinositol acyltransferase
MTKHVAVESIESRRDVIPTTSRVVRAVRVAGTAIALVTIGFAVNLAQLLLSPISLISRPLAHKLNSCVTWFSWTLCHFMITQGYVQITTSGAEELPMGESAFCIANHVFFADWLLIHVVARRKGMLPYCRYFLKVF